MPSHASPLSPGATTLDLSRYKLHGRAIDRNNFRRKHVRFSVRLCITCIMLNTINYLQNPEARQNVHSLAFCSAALAAAVHAAARHHAPAAPPASARGGVGSRRTGPTAKGGAMRNLRGGEGVKHYEFLCEYSSTAVASCTMGTRTRL